MYTAENSFSLLNHLTLGDTCVNSQVLYIPAYSTKTVLLCIIIGLIFKDYFEKKKKEAELCKWISSIDNHADELPLQKVRYLILSKLNNKLPYVGGLWTTFISHFSGG